MGLRVGPEEEVASMIRVLIGLLATLGLMPKLSPQEGADKWATRLAGSTEDIRRGIARVTEAPGARAAAKRAKWEAGLNRSKDKWQRNVAAVGLEEWRNKASTVGVSRVAEGAQANKDKYAKVAGELYSHIDSGLAAIRNMPDSSLEERIAKSAAFQRHMANFRRSGGGQYTGGA